MSNEQSMDVVRAVNELADWIVEAWADKKFDAKDLFSAMTLAPSFKDAAAGITQVKSEWQGLSDEEKDTLVAAFGIAMRKLLEAPFK
jgi:hypothetical protein